MIQRASSLARKATARAISHASPSIGKTLRDARTAIEGCDDTPARTRALDVLHQAAEHGGPFVFIARISAAKALLGEDPPPIGRRRLTRAEQFKTRRAEYLRKRKKPASVS